MGDALCNRFGQVVYSGSKDSAGLQPEYDRWCQARADAHYQIKRLLRLTGNLPVVGDHLQQHRTMGGSETLRIDKRLFFMTEDSEPVLVVYEVSSEELENWEADWEADLLAEEE